MALIISRIVYLIHQLFSKKHLLTPFHQSIRNEFPKAACRHPGEGRNPVITVGYKLS